MWQNIKFPLVNNFDKVNMLEITWPTDAGQTDFKIFPLYLTAWDGWGRTKLNLSSLTGVTKGVVSGVASIAASGGDSNVLMPLVGTCSLGVGEFNSHLRLGVQKLSAIDDESRVEINIKIEI